MVKTVCVRDAMKTLAAGGRTTMPLWPRFGIDL